MSMKGFLDDPKIEYIFFHLSYYIELSDEIKNKFRFKPSKHYNGEEITNEPCIYFPLSEQELDSSKIISIDNIPVLFPFSLDLNKWYSIQNKSLVFHHDILKSAFYLLSGYQELNQKHIDDLGRYNFQYSIQKELSIVQIPVVNYYFKIIINAIELFCEINNIKIKKRKLFEPFSFLLTHDVDRVNKYHFWEVALKIQQAIGLKPNPYIKKKTLYKVTTDYVLNYLRLKRSKNDFWNFEYLRGVENKNGLRSVFFFLDKEGLHDNSRYNFNDEKIKGLVNFLISENCEIGLHGTTFSYNKENYMKKCKNNLQRVSSQKILGNRQHYLKFDRLKTPSILFKSGLEYDSTLGFPHHEGFRNSYCLPFKLFDFEENKMLDLWELPLNVMDGTLFYYRKLNYNQMFESIENLINEIKKFNGLFTLLWHNSHFDENEFPGIQDFYEELLNFISGYSPLNYTGNEIVEILDSNFTK